MRKTWRMRHSLATPALQVASAVIVTRPDERNGNTRVRCIWDLKTGFDKLVL